MSGAPTHVPGGPEETPAGADRRGRGRPASLRGRVVLGVLALLTVLLVTLFSTVDLALRERLDADLRTRLTDRVQLAQQLDGALSPQQLVDRLRGDGVTVRLCSATGSTSSSATSTTATGSPTGSASGSDSSDQPACYEAEAVPAVPTAGPPTPGNQGRPSGGPPGDRPSKKAKPSAPAPPAASTPEAVESSGPLLYVRTTLPISGQVLTLAVDRTQVGDTLKRLVVLEIVGGVVALLLAALLLRWVVASALRPLDTMTGLATSIAAGDRGRRLRMGRPDTELGRTATAFDDMLDELESALAEAAAAETRLRRFLSDVSHELRTPLAGVAATAETLLREATIEVAATDGVDAVDDLDGDARERREQAYVRLIRETRRANRLVDDLLTVARLDTGMQLRTGAVDLVDVVRDDVQRVTEMGADVEIATDVPAATLVDADRVRLSQILSNLLDNAVRAAGPGGRLAVRLGRDDAGRTTLDVLDDGPGVAAADRERIFERLVRLDDSRSRRSGGFGLGLPIARALARAHGGDLVCLSGGLGPDGRGATFRLTLPRPRPRSGASSAPDPGARDV